jgi:hypothetical protein
VTEVTSGRRDGEARGLLPGRLGSKSNAAFELTASRQKTQLRFEKSRDEIDAGLVQLIARAR